MTTMQLDQLLADRQTQSGAAIPSIRIFKLAKHLKQPWQIFLRDADTSIRNRNHDRRIQVTDLRFVYTASGSNCDPTFRRKPNCIGE